MKRGTPYVLIPVLALLSALAIACGSDDDKPAPQAAMQPSVISLPTATTPVATPTGGNFRLQRSPEDAVAALLKTHAPQLASCPVTQANGKRPPGERPSPGYHGDADNSLFTTLWPESTVVFGPGLAGEIAEDGAMSIKWAWWRPAGETLVVTGKRLDAQSPPLEAHYDHGPYAGQPVQAGGLTFPAAGCWEVTGKAGQASLTFVTRVIRVPPQDDALRLRPLAQQASQRVKASYPDAVLRQVDIVQTTGDIIFSFATRRVACISISCYVTAQGSLTGSVFQWTVSAPGIAPTGYAEQPELDLGRVGAGPNAVAESAAAFWPGCTPTGLTLSDEGGGVHWSVFCRLADGRVAKGMADTGLGLLWETGPPVFPPPTLPSVATPTVR